MELFHILTRCASQQWILYICSCRRELAGSQSPSFEWDVSSNDLYPAVLSSKHYAPRIGYARVFSYEDRHIFHLSFASASQVQERAIPRCAPREPHCLSVARGYSLTLGHCPAGNNINNPNVTSPFGCMRQQNIYLYLLVIWSVRTTVIKSSTSKLIRMNHRTR